jgi:hypothetical protein
MLVFWIYPSIDQKVVPSRFISKSIALEPASHVTGVEALELGAKASSARYTAAAAAFFESNPELSLVRSYSRDVSMPSHLERSEAASSARYSAAAAAFLAANPELNLVRSMKGGGSTSISSGDSILAENPELSVVRSFKLGR